MRLQGRAISAECGVTSDSSSVEQEQHQKILGRVWQVWNSFVLVRLTQCSCAFNFLLQPQMKGWGLTSVPHCRNRDTTPEL